MTEFLVGAGGWAYFEVPELRSLDAYARAFNFVEVNSTFYKLPSMRQVESWRKRVPPGFEFSVRCHRDVTHKYKLEPTDEAFRVFRTTTKICNALKSRFLVLQTPPETRFTKEKISSARCFFESIDPKGTRIVWEVRTKGDKPIPKQVVQLIRDYGIIRCVDLSRESPEAESDIFYTRVFGRGQHNVYQFTDEELTEIDTKIAERDPDMAAVSFHNVRMYKDAARFKIYKETNKFPSVTGAEGRQSLRKVLSEDAKFPTVKKELLKHQGWKVVDLTKNRRIHASTLLKKLPDREFRDINDVLGVLQRIIN